MHYRPLALVIAVVASLSLLLASYGYVQTRRLLAQAKHVRGTVVALIPDPSRGGTRQPLRPRVRFTDDAGTVTEFDASFAAFPPPYNVGDTVGVLVPIDRPSDARIDSFSGKWLAPAIFGSLSAIGFSVSSILYAMGSMAARQRRQREKAPANMEANEGR